jgi:hypothetical protein
MGYFFKILRFGGLILSDFIFFIFDQQVGNARFLVSLRETKKSTPNNVKNRPKFLGYFSHF